jgi:rhomboid protease GluP
MGKFILDRTLLSRPVKKSSLLSTLFIVSVVSLLSSIYILKIGRLNELMEASGFLVFKQHQYYRLWTTLFAHGDLEHILSNLLLFVPFAIYLTNYFGLFLFPIIGIFLGGIINFFVLKTMPLEVSLIGISGVVHWMGATWITLYFLIDKRSSIKSRWLKCTGVAAVLFIPNTFSVNISYLSHGIGFIFGAITGTLYFLVFKNKIENFNQFIYEPTEEDYLIDEEELAKNESNLPH